MLRSFDSKIPFVFDGERAEYGCLFMSPFLVGYNSLIIVLTWEPKLL